MFIFKIILTLIKWYFFAWIFIILGSIAAAIVAGIFAALFSIELNAVVLALGFTVIMFIEKILKSKKKKAKASFAGNAGKAGNAGAGAGASSASGASRNVAAGASGASSERAAEAARERGLTNDYAIKLDGYRSQLEVLARKIKDRQTANQVKGIVSTLRKIVMEVESDPRDRKKARSLVEHSGPMIVDLVEKYMKLEKQDQSSDNISATMWEIRSALDTVDTALKKLLDDLFSNDGAEVATNIAVLESILNSSVPDLKETSDELKQKLDDQKQKEERVDEV